MNICCKQSEMTQSMQSKLRPVNIFIQASLLSALLLSMTASDPQSRKMTEMYFPDVFQVESVTPALKKEKGFTRYDELIGFMTEIQKMNPGLVELRYLGVSHQGKRIPWVRIGKRVRDTSVSAEKPIEVWMQGGLHGDEPASTEGLLYLIYQCVKSWDSLPYMHNLTLNVVPMVNPDGFEIQERENAQGLDLNRDQTKLLASESIPLKQAMAEVRPDVAVDFHEYRPFRRDYVHMGSFGVCGAYDVMFLNSNHPNIPQAWIELRKDHFEKPVREVLDRNSITHHDYFTPEKSDGKTVFRIGSDNPRSSSSNFSLQGIIATLVEVRGVGLGRTSFRRRIYTTYLVAQTYLEQASKAAPILRAHKMNRFVPDSLSIRSKRTQRPDSLLFLDIDNNQPIRLGVWLDDARLQQVLQKRKCPVAYAIPFQQSEIISRLHAFGLQGDTLPAGSRLKVETYQTGDVSYDPVPYEKVKLIHLTVQTKQSYITTTEPLIQFSMTQAGALIMPELLEPDASGSLFHFSVVDVKPHAQLPLFRVVQ